MQVRVGMGQVEYSDHIWKISDWETQDDILPGIPGWPESAPKMEPQLSEIRQSLHEMVSDKPFSLLNGQMNEQQQVVDPG
jgi:hypothetical protein